MKKQISPIIAFSIIILIAGIAGAAIFLFSQEDRTRYGGIGIVIIEGTETIEKPAEEEIAEIFETSLPVTILDIFLRESEHEGLSLYDTNVGGILKDNKGKELAFAYSRELGAFKYYFYVGADHPGKEGAVKILHGSKEEKELLKILESWDYSEWQPKNQLDNTKAFALMFIRELKGEFPPHRSENISPRAVETKKGKINRVYKNEKLGFEISFPENWFIKDYENGLFMQKPEILIISGLDLGGASHGPRIHVTVKEVDIYEEDIIDKFYKDWEIQEKILVSGQNAYFITRGGYGPDSCLVTFINNKFLYEIRFGSGCWGEGENQIEIMAHSIKLEDQEHLNTEKEILSTFQLLGF
jgi:hypothetical protein